MKLKFLRAICIAVLCSILVAGVWPFNPFRPNDTHWITDSGGLSFGTKGGILVSSRPLSAPLTSDEPYGSLEILFEPGSANNTNTFFSLSNHGNPGQLALRQYFDTLEVQHRIRDEQHQPAFVGIRNVFHPHKQRLITVASGIKGTAIYVDGMLANTTHHLALSAKDFSGQIVIGTSPESLSPWIGRLLGLAIYQQELTPSEVLDHYKIWIGNRASGMLKEAAALYTFDEGAGSIVHNRGTAGPSLIIPASFQVPHPRLLERPWTRVDTWRSYLSDLIINFAGFIPFGFFFCPWFSLRRPNSYATLKVIVFGAMISLTIETLQVYLPTRDSDLTDVIANTTGAAAGAVLHQWAVHASSRQHRDGVPRWQKAVNFLLYKVPGKPL